MRGTDAAERHLTFLLGPKDDKLPLSDAGKAATKREERQKSEHKDLWLEEPERENPTPVYKRNSQEAESVKIKKEFDRMFSYSKLSC